MLPGYFFPENKPRLKHDRFDDLALGRFPRLGVQQHIVEDLASSVTNCPHQELVADCPELDVVLLVEHPRRAFTK